MNEDFRRIIFSNEYVFPFEPCLNKKGQNNYG